jgi:hypothetical protein
LRDLYLFRAMPGKRKMADFLTPTSFFGSMQVAVVRGIGLFKDQLTFDRNVANGWCVRNIARKLSVGVAAIEQYQEPILIRGGPFSARPITRASAYPAVTMLRAIALARSDSQEISNPPDVWGSVKRWRCQSGISAGSFTSLP